MVRVLPSYDSRKTSAEPRNLALEPPKLEAHLASHILILANLVLRVSYTSFVYS